MTAQKRGDLRRLLTNPPLASDVSDRVSRFEDASHHIVWP
jgi:hypothetical protein